MLQRLQASVSASNVNVLGLATAALLILRFTLASKVGLTEDEAYYRLWSLAPALSYLDHPPMVAWLIAVGRYLAGDNELGVRLLAPLLLAGGTWVQWSSANLLVDRKTAVLATWLFLALPLLAVGGVIITPDLPSVLCFGLVIFALAKIETTQNANWWLAVGLFAGCGLLSKYTNLFAGATIVLWLITVPKNRAWFSARQLWAGGVLCFAIATPVFVWNATHGWASFAKQFGRVADTQSNILLHQVELVAGLVGLMSPVIGVLSIAGLVLVTQKAITGRDSRYALIAASIWPILLYFVSHAFHGRVQPNWLAPIYPQLALCGAVALRRLPRKADRLAFLAAVSIGFISTAMVYAHAVSPLIPLRKDPTEQMRGWEHLARALEGLAQANDVRWIATSSYGTTGELSFSLRNVLPVAQLDAHIRHEHLPRLSKDTVSHPALYVELERRSSEGLLAQCFSSFERVASISRYGHHREGASYVVYRVAGWKAGCAGEDGLPFAAPVRR